MTKKPNRPSLYCEVKMLSEYSFDKAHLEGYQYINNRYFLVREPDNKFDSNAVIVYLSNLKIGYIDRQSAEEVSKMLANGDAYSVEHDYSKRGTQYDPAFDNKYGDGYYRILRIRVFNESQIADKEGM